MTRINPTPFFSFFFRDAARPIELLMATNLFAWAYTMIVNPSVLMRDSYMGFHSAPVWLWTVVFLGVAIFLLFATFRSHARRATCRQAALMAAAFCWALVSVSFIAAGVGTTANANYTIYTILCIVTGVHLSWTAA